MTDYSNEQWKPILGYNEIFKDRYEISDYGRVKSLAHIVDTAQATRVSKSGKVSGGKRVRKEVEEKILFPEKTSNGYYRVTLFDKFGNKKKIRVHQLVAAEFHENPDPEHKTEVGHIDGNKCNNRADNLRWVTRAENIRYAQERNGNYQAEHSRKKAVICLDTGKRYETIAEAARWAAQDETVTPSTLRNAMSNGRAYYGHVFVLEENLSSIENLEAYRDKLLAEYRNNTPSEEKAIMGKRKRKKGWKNPAKKLFSLDGAVTPART